MRVVKFHQNLLDACAQFWWSIYEHKLYALRPDGYPIINTPAIGPGCFSMFIEYGLNGHFGAEHWGGEVISDSIFLAEDSGKVVGILVSSVHPDKLTGNILSAYMQRDNRGDEIGSYLLSKALK